MTDGQGSPWLRDHGCLIGNKDLRLSVQSQAACASNFSTPDCKKNQLGTLSQGKSNLQLWPDSYKGVDCALSPDESILHKINTFEGGMQKLRLKLRSLG